MEPPMPSPTDFRRRLLAGELLCGTFCAMGSPVAAEIALIAETVAARSALTSRRAPVTPTA